MCYFHILYYLTFAPLITKQPQMVSRHTTTINIENSSQILDTLHRLTDKAYANIQRFRQQNYKLIKPSNLNPFKKPSPMPPPKPTPLTSMNFHENSINLKGE
jgi:hypothetical protein